MNKLASNEAGSLRPTGLYLMAETEVYHALAHCIAW